MKAFKRVSVYACRSKTVTSIDTGFNIEPVQYNQVCDDIQGELRMSEMNDKLTGELEVGRHYLVTVEELPELPKGVHVSDGYKDLIDRLRRGVSDTIRKFRE